MDTQPNPINADLMADEREARLVALEAALWRELQSPATQDLATLAMLLSAHNKINKELRFGHSDSAQSVRGAGNAAA